MQLTVRLKVIASCRWLSLVILARDREAFLDDFEQTLDKFAVPAEEQAELKAIVNSTLSIAKIQNAFEMNNMGEARNIVTRTRFMAVRSFGE